MTNTTDISRCASLPYVTQAAGRWYAGTGSAIDRGTSPSARWYRAMAVRLHCAAEQTSSASTAATLRDLAATARLRAATSVVD